MLPCFFTSMTEHSTNLWLQGGWDRGLEVTVVSGHSRFARSNGVQFDSLLSTSKVHDSLYYNVNGENGAKGVSSLCLFALWFGSSGYEPTVLYLAANGDHARCDSSTATAHNVTGEHAVPLAVLFSVFWTGFLSSLSCRLLTY